MRIAADFALEPATSVRGGSDFDPMMLTSVSAILTA
ncbi:hypothetical protein ATER59S_05455 [Aquamicrobium terrae]|jgi:hypothetical protein